MFWGDLAFYRVSVGWKWKLRQNSRMDLIVSGLFWILEEGGFVYMNHSVEKSCKLSSLPSSRGSLFNLFSWRYSFLSLVRLLILLEMWSSRLLLTWRDSRLISR